LTALLFQIRLLGLIGFRPQTDHCAACGKGRLTGEPQFSPVSGGLVCVVCAARRAFRCLPLSRGSLAFLHQALMLSPAVVDRLKIPGFLVGVEIAPGVPVLRAVGGNAMLLALKSGNFGGPQFFSDALSLMR